MNNNIRYSQCWEDADFVIDALKPSANDTIISISSGGCNTFTLAAYKPLKIIAVDSNPAQNHLLRLKLKAFQSLQYEEVVNFLGYKNEINRLLLFNKFKDLLSQETNEYWSLHQKDIENGVIQCGKFEKYIQIFRTIILPCIHSKKTIAKLLSIDSKQSQQEFYENTWNNLRWRLLFKLFFSGKIMKLLGRHREMFRYNNHFNPGEIYFNRASQAFKNDMLRGNHYLEYILTGKKTTVPFFMSKSAFDSISTYQSLIVEDSHLLLYLKKQPSNSFNKFNLSDIFEPLSLEDSNELFEEIYRTSKDNARIIFWNNLVVRKPPEYLQNFFILDQEMLQSLEKNKKIFFYEACYIYTIKK